jgi:putative transposase
MAEDHRKLAEEVAQGILLDDPSFLKEIVRRVLQELLEAEMTEHMGAAPYERSEDRKGHRNGHKPRTLRTRVGTLNLLVPQDREGTFSTRLFSRYQRNEKALVLALMEMYVEGVSTRKVKDVTEELCGTSFSKSTVSDLAANLDAELRAWRSRPLKAKAYPYLFVDACYEKVRVDRRVVSQGVLVVSAVGEDGFREILGVEVADTETEATYQELFRSLKTRGLRGVQLVISDDHEGLKSAISRHFQGAFVAAVPGALRQEPPRDGGDRQAQGARGGPASDFRRHEQGASSRTRLDRGRAVARQGPREGGRAHRGARRGVPKLPGLPREPSKAHPHD